MKQRKIRVVSIEQFLVIGYNGWYETELPQTPSFEKRGERAL
jgi:hypothetical protein